MILTVTIINNSEIIKMVYPDITIEPLFAILK